MSALGQGRAKPTSGRLRPAARWPTSARTRTLLRAAPNDSGTARANVAPSHAAAAPRSGPGRRRHVIGPSAEPDFQAPTVPYVRERTRRRSRETLSARGFRGLRPRSRIGCLGRPKSGFLARSQSRASMPRRTPCWTRQRARIVRGGSCRRSRRSTAIQRRGLSRPARTRPYRPAMPLGSRPSRQRQSRRVLPPRNGSVARLTVDPIASRRRTARRSLALGHAGVR